MIIVCKSNKRVNLDAPKYVGTKAVKFTDIKDFSFVSLLHGNILESDGERKKHSR